MAEQEPINVEFDDPKSKKVQLRDFLSLEKGKLKQSKTESGKERTLNWAKDLLGDYNKWDTFVSEVKDENLLETYPSLVDVIINRGQELKKKYEENPDQISYNQYLTFIKKMESLLS